MRELYQPFSFRDKLTRTLEELKPNSAAFTHHLHQIGAVWGLGGRRYCALFYPGPAASECRYQCTEGCPGAVPAQIGDVGILGETEVVSWDTLNQQLEDE